MKINDNSYGSLPTNQSNYNGIVNNNINLNKIKPEKNFKFNQNVEVYNIESYKALNKELTYNEEEGLAELLKENPNFKLFNDDFKRHLSQDSNSNNTRNYNSVNSQFGNFRNPNAMRRNVDPQCCCIIL